MQHGLQLAWITVLKMCDGFFEILPNLVIAGGVFFIFHLLSKLAGKASLSISTHARVDLTLASAISKLVGVVVYVLGLLVCAVIVVPNFSADKLIAGLGIGSVAIGFAFQNILQNFFAGMLLLWQKPFGIGDEIKAKDYEGTVEDITIRTTLLKTHSGQRVYIPNGILFTEPVTVNTAYGHRLVHLQIPFKDIADEKAVETAKRVLADVDTVLKDPEPKVYVSASNGAMSLDIYFWANARNAELIEATDQATWALDKALRKLVSDKPRKVA